jgi:hypothetical protein
VTTAIIRGPEDKSVFRNDPENWTGYVDPLPACDIATPTGETHVSMSTIKDSWPKFLKTWHTTEAAKTAWKFRSSLVDMTEAEAIDLIAPSSDRQRNAAADRGHSIHDLLEFYLHDGDDSGIELLDDGDDAGQYVDTLRLIASDCQPEVVASEVVVFGVEDGYPWAGTFDSIWKVTEPLLKALGPKTTLQVGDLVIVDYKSRKPGKAANRWPEEGVQVGGYSTADYWVIEDGEGIRRRQPMTLNAGLIVSIAPEGYRLYEVDLMQARRHWTCTVQFHRTRQSAPEMFSRAVGRNVPKTASSPGEGGVVHHDAEAAAPSPERQAWLLRRIDAIKDAGHVETLRLRIPVDCPGIPLPAPVRAGNATWTAEQQDLVAKMLTTVEAAHELPFGEPDPTAERPEPTFAQPTSQPPGQVRQLRPSNEEGTAPDVAVAELRQRLASMPDHQRQHVVGWSKQAITHDPHLAWNMGEPPVQLRRYAIASAALELVKLVKFIDDGEPRWMDEDRVRTALSIVLGDEALQETLPVGALLGALTIDEADRLATHRLDLEDGTPRLVAA